MTQTLCSRFRKTVDVKIHVCKVTEWYSLGYDMRLGFFLAVMKSLQLRFIRSKKLLFYAIYNDAIVLNTL